MSDLNLFNPAGFADWLGNTIPAARPFAEFITWFCLVGGGALLGLLLIYVTGRTINAFDRAPFQRDARPARGGGLRIVAYFQDSFLYANLSIVSLFAYGGAAFLFAQDPDGELAAVATSKILAWLWYLQVADIALSFVGQGPRRFLRSGWNWSDVVIVVSWLLGASPMIGAWRLVRLIRLFRLVSSVPQLRIVAEAAYVAISGIMAFIAILSIMVFVFAVIGVEYFREVSPDLFGNFSTAFVTLVGIASLNAWDDPAVRELLAAETGAWPYFLVSTIMFHFVLLGMAAAVVSDAVQQSRAAEFSEIREIEEISEIGGKEESSLLEEIRSLRAEVQALRADRN